MRAEIYGNERCSYCKLAVSLCETNDIEVDYIDVDNSENLRVLRERVGIPVKTIPQIFLDGQFIPGGFNGLKQELAKG